MKLAKKISKGIALCAALTIIGLGGVLTSCSNNSSDNTKPELDEDLPEGWTAISVGEIEKYNGGGTAEYTVIKNNNGSIAISHNASMAKYASCSFKPNFGDSNTLYTKITNNSDVAATVQVQVNKAGTEDNDYNPTPTVIAVYIDGEKHTDGVEYSKEYKLEPNASVVIVNKFDPSKNPDTVAISLNSQEKVAGTVEKGKITVSGISMKKVTDDSELETATTGSGDTDTGDGSGSGAGTTGGTGGATGGSGTTGGTGGNGGGNTTGTGGGQGGGTGDTQGGNQGSGQEPETPKETVLYKLDFSGAEPPENYYYDEEKFEANVGAKIEGAWNTFSIVPSDDASVLKDATHVKIVFKCSADAAFDANDNINNKFMLGIYKDGGEANGYKETNVRWTCFLNGGEDDLPSDFTTVEKKIEWEQKYNEDGETQLPYADFESTSNFRIWDCNLTSGTLYVQSVEFIKK